jgi:hypothetical protein
MAHRAIDASSLSASARTASSAVFSPGATACVVSGIMTRETILMKLTMTVELGIGTSGDRLTTRLARSVGTRSLR